MASPLDRTIAITVHARASDPHLLEGLDAWVKLGLISDFLVQKIAQEQLSCPLPEQEVQEIVPVVVSKVVSEPIALAPSLPRPVAPLNRWLQSLMEEVSVLWLLFLGVFLVVVSSAVLAASQWQNFSAVGQYLVLLTYTLAFWGAGLWAGRQANLVLTAKMLQRVTLLLVPINFWAMDGFGLWRWPLGWVVAGVGAIALTLVLLKLLRPRLHQTPYPKLVLTNAIALSLLHWGWAVAIWPLLATYTGMVGTAIATVYADSEAEAQGESADPQGANSAVNSGSTPSFVTLNLLFGALLLVGRALLAAQIPLWQLGLALGLCGAVLAWRARRQPTQGLWLAAGYGLMVLGWAVSLRVDPPGQPVVVTVLALGLLGDRLKRLRLPLDLTLIFLVGLQGIWLARRFVPLTVRDGWVEKIGAIAGDAGMPFAIVGVTVFPYLILFALWSRRLRRQNLIQLATQADFLAFVLGCGLTLFSVANPLIRALNLTLSAILLGVSIRRRPAVPNWVVYLIQALVWGAIFSWIHIGWSGLPRLIWGFIALGAMAIEWSFSVLPESIFEVLFADRFETVTARPVLWRRSAWVFGFIFAGLSYVLLLVEPLASPRSALGMAWWIAPAFMVLMARSPRCLSPRTTQTLAVFAVIFAQVMSIGLSPYRIVGYGLGALLTGINSLQLRKLPVAAIAIGFGLATGWYGVERSLALGGNGESLLLLMAIETAGLWFFWTAMQTRQSELIGLYRRAANGWAIALFIPLQLGLLIFNLFAYFDSSFFGFFEEDTLYFGVAFLPTLALALSCWRAPNNWNAHGGAIALASLMAVVVHLAGQGATGLAIAYLSFAVLLQRLGDFWLGDFWQARIQRHSRPDCPQPAFLGAGHSVPILYAILGGLIGHHHFTATTGLLTLAAAAVGVGVGRRRPTLKPFSYIGLILSSIGFYELLIYQLSRSPGGAAGDGVMLLALLAVGIAWGDRLCSRWLRPYLRWETGELRVFAQIHWGIGSGLALLALLLPLSGTGGLLWMGGLVLLGLHALGQARQAGSGWTDLGIIQLLSALGYGIHLGCPWPVLLAWAGAIACPIAALLYGLPWQRLGWNLRPWRRWAMLLPMITVLLTSWDIRIQALLIVAAFYAGLATHRRQVRLSYLSIVLLDWAMLRILHQFSITEPLVYALLGGGSLLYFAQVEPQLQAQSDRQQRHWLRVLGTSIVCFTAMYQAEIGLGNLSPFGAGLGAIAFSLLFIFAGLALRIRAFLYIGTFTFMLRVLIQVWRFVQDYSLFLWAIGIVLGLLLIWIAATFEARRSQVIALLNYWVNALDAWE